MSLENGIQIIKDVQKTLSSKPGVYRMLGAKDKVLYVGKARQLNKRVANYTRPDPLPTRLKRMIAETLRMEIIETHTELEALLLEFNLIKELKPVYNILLKDDKAFPYLHISADHDFPRLVKHRGTKDKSGDYYGPFATVGAMNNTMDTLQKIFQIRNCSDHYFATRKRPCLQYHIKRCTAPCVGKVTKDEYEEQITHIKNFLSGKSRQIQDDFSHKMQAASHDENFEEAALYRDRIRALTAVQSSQMINLQSDFNADIFALIQEDGLACLSVFFIRHGRNFGNRTYFPKQDHHGNLNDLLSHLMVEFYARHPIMPTILTNISPANKNLISDLLSEKLTKKVTLSNPSRGPKREITTMAIHNAQSALSRYKAQNTSDLKGLERLKDLFDLDEAPKRIEVYDNSHTGGEHMTGGMIVATPDGFSKSAYRKFNIREAKNSDDYGMMREVMTRRFKRALEEDDKGIGSESWPDLVLIDGGKGQLSAVTETLEDLGILDDVTLVSIAKGPDRNAGREEFYMNNRPPFRLPPNDIGLFYLQRLRDEAHRYAIGSMRTRRAKTIEKSPLDNIPGIGPTRKKALLSHFGSGKAASRAALYDLEKVPGISKNMAKQIYNHFHDG